MTRVTECWNPPRDTQYAGVSLKGVLQCSDQSLFGYWWKVVASLICACLSAYSCYFAYFAYYVIILSKLLCVGSTVCAFCKATQKFDKAAKSAFFLF